METDRIYDATVDNPLVKDEVLALFGERAQDLAARTRELEGLAWKAFRGLSSEDPLIDELEGGTRAVVEEWHQLGRDLRDYARRLATQTASVRVRIGRPIRERTSEENRRVASLLAEIDLDAVDWPDYVARLAFAAAAADAALRDRERAMGGVRGDFVGRA
jgi:hypothetical protein